MSTQKEEPSNLDKEQSWRHHTPDIRIYHKAALRHRHLLGGAHDLCGRWPFVEGDPLSSSVHRPSDSHPVFPMPQVSRMRDSGPARLVGLREFTRLPWLQPLPGLKDGAQPGLLCSPASTSGKEWRALGSLAHPQSGAGQAPNSSSREADVASSLPSVCMAPLRAPAPRRRGAPRPWLWASPGSCPGGLGSESTPSPWSSSTGGLRALEKGIPGTTGWRGARSLLDQQQWSGQCPGMFSLKEGKSRRSVTFACTLGKRLLATETVLLGTLCPPGSSESGS